MQFLRYLASVVEVQRDLQRLPAWQSFDNLKCLSVGEDWRGRLSRNDAELKVATVWSALGE